MSFLVVNQKNKFSSSSGFTILELITVMTIAGILSGMAVMNLNALSNTSENAAAEFAAFLKQTRARAITSTAAYFVQPSNNHKVITKIGNNCSDTSPVVDPLLAINFPTGASLASTTWSLCFSSRGLSDSNLSVTINDIHSRTRTVEVLLGGSIRIN